jgi:hypothetical protein
MYYLIIWDKNLGAPIQGEILSKLEVPLDLANIFFQMDSAKFPILCSLSFDDYDLFSDKQLESLIHELLGVASIHPSYSEPIGAMLKLISMAQSSGKAILFDPFREE